MRVLTLGAGTVGRWIADILCRRRHSVTVVDIDPENVRRINSELDVRAIEGSGSQSTVLFQADVCARRYLFGCDRRRRSQHCRRQYGEGSRCPSQYCSRLRTRIPRL